MGGVLWQAASMLVIDRRCFGSRSFRRFPILLFWICALFAGRSRMVHVQVF